MNLFGVVAAAVSPVNKRELLTIYSPHGYTTNPDGGRIPSTAVPTQVLASVQEAVYDDLQQNGGINLSAENLTAYLPGNWSGVLRADQKDGDIIVRPNGTRWLVIAVPENWQDLDGWTKVLMTRQLNS